MRFKLNIPEDSIKNDFEYTSDVLNQNKNFPVLIIGRDSYIEEAIVENVLDENLIYNVQVGRHSSIAHDVTFVVDMNHDYKRACQGRINGVKYRRPEQVKRKGQIIIMNDCWIGEKATIMSGVTIGNGAVVAAEAVVSKDVPAYAVVAGNPAKIIGYRFDEKQIELLNLIRWWNWDKEKVVCHAGELFGDIDDFIEKHINSATKELTEIVGADITPIEKQFDGEERIYLYIPDFEQDYPTYPKVIDAFAKSFADTNTELLLYVREDEFLEDKLALLDEIFSFYEDVNCYINLYVGNLSDERSLFGQVDAYITNRSIDNVIHMDMADLFGIPVISGVDMPIFNEINTKVINKAETKDKSVSTDSLDDVIIQKFVQTMKSQNSNIELIMDKQKEIAENQTQIFTNQYVMNCTINNLKYEIINNREALHYPIIESGDKAIELIINEGKSICRFGDGEFAVIAGVNRQKFQRADEKLAARLKEILSCETDDVLLCLMDVYGDLSKYNDECRYNVRAYLSNEVRKQHYELIDMKKTYYDTYLTRPYVSYMDNNTDAPKKRFENLKRIWQDKSLLIIEGEKTRMGVGNDLFDNAKDIIRILGPAEHAFERYDEILSKALEQDKNRLVLIAMGATATVLSYDLAKAGFQALDIGHVDMEYEWMLAGKGKRTAIKHKYNNEVDGGNVVQDIDDPEYEKQIIERIY
ncbi:MAG: DUF1792 domain-containing protein [Lachnospiraceae bacterium]|nr:DUF1792 domain-containing protein [Lachnospiraceae bacterium]